MYETIARLSRENKAYQERIKELEPRLEYAKIMQEDIIASYEQEVERLREALEKYGKHGENCLGGLSGNRHPCRCGLEALKGE
jgi:hypothetical protein